MRENTFHGITTRSQNADLDWLKSVQKESRIPGKEKKRTESHKLNLPDEVRRRAAETNKFLAATGYDEIEHHKRNTGWRKASIDQGEGGRYAFQEDGDNEEVVN